MRFKVSLPEQAADALVTLALREFRAPDDQAAYLLVEALRRAGVLPEDVAAPAERTPPAEVAR